MTWSAHEREMAEAAYATARGSLATASGAMAEVARSDPARGQRLATAAGTAAVERFMRASAALARGPERLPEDESDARRALALAWAYRDAYRRIVERVRASSVATTADKEALHAMGWSVASQMLRDIDWSGVPRVWTSTQAPPPVPAPPDLREPSDVAPAPSGGGGGGAAGVILLLLVLFLVLSKR